MKRIGFVTSTALIATLLSVVPISGANAAPVVSSTTTTNPSNSNEFSGTVDANIFTAAILANTAVTHGATTVGNGFYSARSVGLISQDSGSGASQVATVRAGGVLSLYSRVSTTSAYSADGGTFSSSAGVATARITTSSSTNSVLFSLASATATGTAIATLWTAPSSAGTYTVILSASNTSASEVSLTSPTLGGYDASIVVTVTDAIHGTTVSDSAANVRPLIGAANSSLFTAVSLATSGAAVLSSATDVANAHISAKSLGLLTKDSTVGTAQTATVLASGTLSFYANVTTTVAFVASGGTFGTSAAGATATFSQTRGTILMTNSDTPAGIGIGVTWTAPSTAGTYTISMYNGASGTVSLTTPARTLGAQMLVTVVAASAGGSYTASKSFCNITPNTSSLSASTNVDGLAGTINGQSMYVNLALKDAYNGALDDGNIVITATGGALVSYGDAATPTAGTASTAVAYDNGANATVRVVQGTAGAPMQSTVTIAYNGTTVCSKTVAIFGEVAKLAVTVTDVQDLSGSTGKADFLGDGWAPSSPRAGHFYVLATDAAGNQVATSSTGTFATDSASLAGQTIVTAISVDSSATVTSSTSAGRISTGTYTCGATAGEVKTAKITFTNSSTGKVTTSDAFTLRCADDPYSYTASWDKASYVQGEIATLTVKFLDSKGNAANSTSGTGTWTSVTPMLTAISATGAAAGLGLTGTKTYTYTAGIASGITTGTYVSIIDFTTLTGAETAVKATPSYKITASNTDVAFTEVLKSVVALIASINKQIQALQKLILKR
jgi:hypothetical protein